MTSEAEKPNITCQPNRSLLVKGLDNLQNSKGEELPTESMIALCRCGHSETKPFCDGTHKKVGFTDEKLSDGSNHKKENYAGRQITIHDNRGICAHAGICTDQLASVFRLRQEPWIDPDGAEVEKIIETIKQCPSGALSYTMNDVEYREQDRPAMIYISKNGPYYVQGGVELQGVPQSDYPSKEHYALCRCGQSKNKPFCDGSHWAVKFEDDKN